MNNNENLDFIDRYERDCFNHSFTDINSAKKDLEKNLKEFKSTIFNSNDVKRLRQSFVENAIDSFVEDFIKTFNRYIISNIDVNNVGIGFINDYNNTSTRNLQVKDMLPISVVKENSSNEKMKKYLIDNFFKNFCSDKEISSMINLKKELLEVPLNLITNICIEKLNQLKIENSFLSDFNVSCSGLLYNSSGSLIIDLRFKSSFTVSF